MMSSGGGNSNDKDSDLSLPKNFKPSEIKTRERDDGSTSIVYGTERDDTGKITGDHGHTVISKGGTIDYARTQGGQVKVDNKK